MRVLVHRIAIASIAVSCSNACAQSASPPVASPAVPAQPVWQENGKVVVLPTNGIGSKKSGLSIDINTRWANGYGYRPVEVSIQSPKPTTADHLITIRLHSGYESDISAEQDFEIRLGSTRASTIVAVPTYQQVMNCFWWDVWVDGVKDLDLSLDKDDAWQSTAGGSAAAVGTVQILVAGPDANHQSLVSPTTFDFEVLSWKLGKFPHRWIDYTGLDVVALSTSELQQLAQTNPLAFEAIGRWVRSGGQLWVCDVGGKLEQLPQVSKLLQLPEMLVPARGAAAAKGPIDDKNTKSEADNSGRVSQTGWAPARIDGGSPGGQAQAFIDTRTGKSRWTSDPRIIAALEGDSNFVKTGAQSATGDTSPEQHEPEDSSQWFVEQRVGFGLVRAFRGANEASAFAQRAPLNPAAAANANSIGEIPIALRQALGSTPPWQARHGILPDAGSPEFAKFIMPDFGRAPVTQFQVLITLFVLLIGPVNYWLLKRFKRLQLLVLTVPLAAGIATAALFAYAIVSDGFATTVRAHSLTMLDQRTGEAACWSRLSYYSGMAPGRGLTMPADTVVYPILPSWSTESSRAINREVVWEDNEAKLTRGWLMSRTPTQYLSLRARKTPHRIDIVSGAGRMQVTNRLETPINWLLVINEEGKFFAGEELANDSRTPLQPISREKAVEQFGQLKRDNDPEAPAALAGSDRDFTGRRGQTNRRMYGRFRPRPTIDPSIESLANRTLGDLAGLNGRPALDLPPRSYVAVTARGAEVEIGVQRANEEASFHVIVGQW